MNPGRKPKNGSFPGFLGSSFVSDATTLALMPHHTSGRVISSQEDLVNEGEMSRAARLRRGICLVAQSRG